MRKNKELLLIVGSLLGVLVITGLLVFALIRTPSQQDQQGPSDVIVDVEQPGTSSSTPTTTGTPPNADSHNMIDECIAFKKADLPGKESDYQKGSILVTFEKTLKFGDALDLVENNDLSVVSESNARSSFGFGKWFAVKVPSGSEYEWMCIFESSNLVVRALREPTFDLHQ